jgi:hypothetical protein
MSVSFRCHQTVAPIVLEGEWLVESVQIAGADNVCCFPGEEGRRALDGPEDETEEGRPCLIGADFALDLRRPSCESGIAARWK